MKGMAKWVVLVMLIMGVALVGCSRKEGQGLSSKAIAIMNPTEGSKVKGIISFEKTAKGVHLVANIEGLSPGLHGFHVHEFGDCSSPDANSAGGHYNPVDMPHAAPTVEKRHAGDLGNIEADKSGRARLEITDKVLALEGPHSIVGRSVIVHAQADDFKTQPTGSAGARVACGVIGFSK
ncbi:MAG: superoxide dismutase family protein [Syntrophobacter sp.]